MVSNELIGEVLKGLACPCSRAEVIRHATAHGAPERVLHVLDALPERTFHSLDEVQEQINQIQPSG